MLVQRSSIIKSERDVADLLTSRSSSSYRTSLSLWFLICKISLPGLWFSAVGDMLVECRLHNVPGSCTGFSCPAVHAGGLEAKLKGSLSGRASTSHLPWPRLSPITECRAQAARAAPGVSGWLVRCGPPSVRGAEELKSGELI